MGNTCWIPTFLENSLFLMPQRVHLCVKNIIIWLVYIYAHKINKLLANTKLYLKAQMVLAFKSYLLIESIYASFVSGPDQTCLRLVARYIMFATLLCTWRSFWRRGTGDTHGQSSWGIEVMGFKITTERRSRKHSQCAICCS